MKKFEFRLQSLLNLSRQKERLIELSERQLRTEIELERQQIVQLETELDQSATLAPEVAMRVGVVAGAQSQCEFERSQRLQIAQTRGHIDELESRLTELVQERQRQQQESHSLDKLRQEQWLTWRKDSVKAAQEELLENLVHESQRQTADHG